MPDPLQVLPNELWSLCIEVAIDGRLNGPLDFLMVSKFWGGLLLNSPPLWTQIYIQNGEDEMARISTFLHLSKQSPLHVDVMTVLPNMGSLRLVAEHISRVRTISISPGASETVTSLHAKQWKLAVSCVLATLSNGMQLSDINPPSYFGFSLWEDDMPYYHVIYMQFTVEAKVASSDEQNGMWEKHIAKVIPAPAEQDVKARTASISSIARLASYARFYDVMRITIPSLSKLFGDDAYEVRLETIKAIRKLANRVEFRDAVASVIPSLIKPLGDDHSEVRLKAVLLVDELANQVEFRGAIVTTLPALIELLEDDKYYVRSETVRLIGRLATHVEFWEAIAITIPTLNKPLEDNNYYIREKTVELIGELANHTEFREAIATTIPTLIKLLEGNYLQVRLKTAKVIGKLANHFEFREAIITTIPSLIELLEDKEQEVRLEAAAVIGKLANHVEFREFVETMIPTLNKLLRKVIPKCDGR